MAVVVVVVIPRISWNFELHIINSQRKQLVLQVLSLLGCLGHIEDHKMGRLTKEKARMTVIMMKRIMKKPRMEKDKNNNNMVRKKLRLVAQVVLLGYLCYKAWIQIWIWRGRRLSVMTAVTIIHRGVIRSRLHAVVTMVDNNNNNRKSSCNNYSLRSRIIVAVII